MSYEDPFVNNARFEKFCQLTASGSYDVLDAYKQAYGEYDKKKGRSQTETAVRSRAYNVKGRQEFKARVKEIEEETNAKFLKKIEYSKKESFDVFNRNLSTLEKELVEIEMIESVKLRATLKTKVTKAIALQEEYKGRLCGFYNNESSQGGDEGLRDALMGFANKLKEIKNGDDALVVNPDDMWDSLHFEEA